MSDPGPTDARKTPEAGWFLLGLLAGTALAPSAGAHRDATEPLSPEWDGMRRRLVWRGRTLCAFRRRTSAPASILAAFQQCGWDRGLVPDPLRPLCSRDRARRRLEWAVKNLNRRLPRETIRFRHDPDAGGVWWEVCPAPATN